MAGGAPLPRYQDIGVRIAPWQSNAAVAGQAAAQADQALSDNLSRLSTFAFGQAEAQAQVEGREYGAANAPTAEQLKRSFETGEAPPMPGDTSSVFGRAARTGSLEAVTRNVEIEARNKIAELHVTAKSQNMPALEFQKHMQDIIDGYGSSVAKFSPQTAGAIRASLSTVASQQYITYADWALTKETARQKIAVEGGIDTVIKNVANIVQAGDQLGEGSQIVTVDQKLAAERTKILQWSLGVNDAGLANSKLKEFNSAVASAKTATISSWTQDERGIPTLAKYNQIMTGRVTDPQIAAMWNGLTAEERTNTQEAVRKQMNATLSLNAAMEQEQERQRQQAQAKNRIDFHAAYVANDAAKMGQALKGMEVLRDAEGFEKYSEIAATHQSHTEPGLLLSLETELTRGTLSPERIMTLVRDKRLSDTDARGLIGKTDVAYERTVTGAIDYVKRELGFPDRSMINPSAVDRHAIQQVNSITNKLIAAKRQADIEGKAFDPWQFIEGQIKAAKDKPVTPQMLSQAESQAKALGKVMGLPADATYTQISQELARRKLLPEKDKDYRNPRTQVEFENALKLLLNNGSQ